MKSRKMLSTLCAIPRAQMNAVPRFPRINPAVRVQPRLISFGELGTKLDRVVEKTKTETSVKKTEMSDASNIYSKRIDSYVNDGHLKLNFEGRVVQQELADEEKIAYNHYKLSRSCFIYSAVFGAVWIASWTVLANAYHHPLCYDILAMISPIGTIVSMGIMTGAAEGRKKHEEKATDLYKDICRKYQVTKKQED